VRGPGRGGFVGSVAYSPALGKTIALAVVPRELAAPGTEVEVRRGEEQFTATVRSLPFVA
jgi:glycine cleavage system aminomethyltransferase T